MRRLVLIATMFAAAACGDEFEPPSLLSGVRVLAVEASPTEVGPLETVKLVPAVWSPASDPVVAHGWRFCPLTKGPASGYECLFPQCETGLEVAADGSVETDPSLLILACASAALPGGPTQQQTDSIPEVVETVFRYRASTASGQHVDAIVRVPLWTRAAPVSRNQPPIVTSVELEGQVLGSGAVARVAVGATATLRVRVDPASLEAFTDESGRARQEDAMISFFADAGTFEFDREEGTDVSVKWTAEQIPEALTEVTVYAVARDLRGGQKVAGPFKIDVVR